MGFKQGCRLCAFNKKFKQNVMSCGVFYCGKRMEFMVSIFNFIYVSLNYNNCLEAVYIVKSKDPTIIQEKQTTIGCSPTPYEQALW